MLEIASRENTTLHMVQLQSTLKDSDRHQVLQKDRPSPIAFAADGEFIEGGFRTNKSS